MFTKSGKETDPSHDSVNEIKYGFRAGRAYMLIGGKPEDILTTCDSCRAPYAGQCQEACLYCGKARKTFYVDVTNIKLVESVGLERMADVTSFVLPNKDVIQIGDQSWMAEAVAEKILIGYNCKAGLLVGNIIESDKYGSFGTVVISDNGEGSFKSEARIQTLVTGSDVKLKFGQQCIVNNLLTMGNASIDAGYNFQQGNRRNVTYSEVAKLISERLNS